MRLDHLLSKETFDKTRAYRNVLVRLLDLVLSLFNLEGASHSEILGGIAQLVEHLLCKQGVTGSSPVTSTMRANSSAG